jgi:hypothetical protein
VLLNIFLSLEWQIFLDVEVTNEGIFDFLGNY